MGGGRLVGRAANGAALESTRQEGFLSISHTGWGLDVNDAIVHGRGCLKESVIWGFVHILSHVVRLVRMLGLV